MVYDLTPANIVVEDVCLGTATCVTAPEAYELSVTSYEDDAIEFSGVALYPQLATSEDFSIG